MRLWSPPVNILAWLCVTVKRVASSSADAQHPASVDSRNYFVQPCPSRLSFAAVDTIERFNSILKGFLNQAYGWTGKWGNVSGDVDTESMTATCSRCSRSE